ncbi:hypothetical protein [Arthrobacter sp. ES1]|uniref:hypothetical protein n=1 Tax=Arthrobacter sp. ES1 TaxID=1897056 RepID=UPI001CFFCABE|nr:hypothetical protein [Arthrobacter sp. ES1]MCB5280375.1 hypothetical protein [Arthrobacter sp. ES1]
MATNAEYNDRDGYGADRPRPGTRIDGASSQAGLNAFAGGRIKSLSSVPSPGQPGSRFNAVVVDRGERMSREEGVKAPRAKSLPLNMPQGMIQGIPPAIMNQTAKDESEQTVAGAAAQGFAGGFIAGAQNRMFGSAGAGEQDGANPSWQENNRTPVRNAHGESLADLTATVPGEDPLPGTTQPLIMDVIDAARGNVPARPAKAGTQAVVMNPAHVAALESLENRQEDSLESSGSHFGR